MCPSAFDLSVKSVHEDNESEKIIFPPKKQFNTRKTNLVMKYNCPHESKCQLGIAGHDVIGSDVDEFDLFWGEMDINSRLSGDSIENHTHISILEEVNCNLGILEHVKWQSSSLSWLQRGQNEIR